MLCSWLSFCFVLYQANYVAKGPNLKSDSLYLLQVGINGILVEVKENAVPGGI